VAALAAAAGLAASYWFPIAFEWDLVKAARAMFSGYYRYDGHFVDPIDLVRPYARGRTMPLTLGPVLPVLAAVNLLALALAGRAGAGRRLGLVLAAYAAGAIVLTAAREQARRRGADGRVRGRARRPVRGRGGPGRTARRPLIATPARVRVDAGAAAPRSPASVRPGVWTDGRGRALIGVAGGMAMEATLDHVVLWTDDPLRAIAFYRDVVGFMPVRLDEFRSGGAPFPSVRVSDGTILDLMSRAAAPIVDAMAGAGASAGHPVNHVCVAMPAAEFASLRARLEAAGVPISPMMEQSFGAQGLAPQAFYFQDPDGNVLEARHYAR
jgi:catechol 2,3-dioxygenase-like lactoylglutathione lyase family enzyme